MAWQTDDTVDLEIAAWSPSASARAASTSRTDRPRMKDAITRDSRALVLVTWLPNRREANASGVPRSFGLARATRPAGVVAVTSREPFPEPGPGAPAPPAPGEPPPPR